MKYSIGAKAPCECHILKSVALVATGAVFGFLTTFLVMRKLKRINNLGIHDDLDKVVDTVDIEDIGDKKVYCRCWKSKKFPLCDGAHNVFNEVVGDNVGPLVVKSSKA